MLAEVSPEWQGPFPCHPHREGVNRSLWACTLTVSQAIPAHGKFWSIYVLLSSHPERVISLQLSDIFPLFLPQNWIYPYRRKGIRFWNWSIWNIHANIFTYVSWRCDVHCYQIKISFSASDTIISVTWQDNFGTKHHKPHSRHNDKNVNADTSVLNRKWVSNLIFLLVSLSACNSKSQRFRNLILQKRNAYLFVCLFLNTLSLGKMKRESRELRIYNQPESYTMNISRILCEN